MNSRLVKSSGTWASNQDRDLSARELDIVAGGDCYVHSPRGSSDRDYKPVRSGK